MQPSLQSQYQPSYLNGVIKSASSIEFFTEANTRWMPLDASTPQALVSVQHQSNLKSRSITCQPQRRHDDTERSYAFDVASQATLQQHAKAHHLNHWNQGVRNRVFETTREGEDHPELGNHPSNCSNSGNSNTSSAVRHPSKKA